MSPISLQNRQRIGNFLQKIQALLFVVIVFLFFMNSANADQTGTNYTIPFDVNNAGGADVSKSNVYLLSDSLGEPIVGYGSTNNYILNSGYRQPSASEYLSLTCSSIANLGSVVGTGQKTGSGTCTVYTDAYDGYRLVWQAGSNNRGGLVGHWKLDETSGTTAYDSSGKANNGTLTNGPTISTQAPSKFFSTRSISLDGVDDYIQTNFAPSGYTKITMSAWVNLTAAGSYPMVMSYGTNADNVLELRAYDTTGRMELVRRSDNVGIRDSVSIVGTGWHHFAGTSDGTTFKFYKDGVLLGSQTISHNISSATTFRFGRRSNDEGSPYQLTGFLDDIRVYNTALSYELIRDLASLAPPGSLTASGSQTRYIPGIFFPSTGGLVGHWKMEEILGGSTVTDSSGYNRDGTPNGAAGANNLPQSVASVPGSTSFLTTRSLDLDGTDDYVSVSSATQLAGSPLSVSFWTKNDVAPAQFDGQLGKTNGTSWTQGWGFFYNSASEIRFFIEGWSTNVAFASLNPQQWNHVVGTWDGTTMQIYVNGVAGTSDTYAGAMTTSNPFEIGRLGGDAFNIDGQIDDVRIYSRALSLAEVKALYSEPQAWSVAATESAWGGRLSSDSTDDDAKWGTDGGSEKWINIGDGSYTVVRRQSATPLSGSVQYMDFRGEVGSSKVQTSGVYTGVVTFTAVGY